jgi:chromosome segregation ATPase
MDAWAFGTILGQNRVIAQQDRFMNQAQGLIDRYYDESVQFKKKSALLEYQNYELNVVVKGSDELEKVLRDSLAQSERRSKSHAADVKKLEAKNSKLSAELSEQKVKFAHLYQENKTLKQDVERFKFATAILLAESAGRIGEVRELMQELQAVDEDNHLLQPTGRYFVKSANPELNLRVFYDLEFDKKLARIGADDPARFRAPVVEREPDDFHIYDDL